MLPRLAAALLVATALRGCLTYEYEHEVWVQVNGSGSVNVTGRPALWTAFKGLPLDEGDPDAMKKAARELFERSGLDVKRVTVTKRRGQLYLFVSADYRDVNRVSYTPAFPDLPIGLRREGGRLRLDGSWQRPIGALAGGDGAREGLMAVRLTVLPDFSHAHIRVADHVGRSILREALVLNIACSLNPCSNGFRGFSHSIRAQLFIIHSWNFDMDIDTIQERT